MQVDHHFKENLTPERVDAILERLRAEPAPAEDNGHAPRRRTGKPAPLSGPHPPAG